MGKNRQADKKLRQVNIEKGRVSAVSESVYVGQRSLIQTEDLTGDVPVLSPVMKKVERLPIVIPAQAPTEAEVIDAHKEVGLKLAPNSYKHPKRVRRAGEKRALQRSLEQKRAIHVAQDPAVNAFDHCEGLNIEELMHDRDGKTAYERLERNYVEIKQALLYLPGYEREIELRLSQPNLDEAARDQLLRSKAKLKALYDIKAYYEIYERLMRNKYYAMLPHDEMHALSYKELRKRLAGLYGAQPRKQELIDYYQDLIRLREIDLSNGASAAARAEEYYSSLKGDVVKPDERDPLDEMKKMAVSFAKLKEYLRSPRTLLPQGTRAAYVKTFLDTFGPDIEKFRAQIEHPRQDIIDMLEAYDEHINNPAGGPDELYRILQEKKPADQDIPARDDGMGLRGIELSDDQINGVKRIGAWVLRHSVTERNKKVSFAFNMMSTRPEQQLIIFYLVENDRLDDAMGIDFFTALHNYQPDLENFKKKTDWEKLSRAVQISTTLTAQMRQYGSMIADIEAEDANITADESGIQQPERTLQQKRTSVIRAMAYRGVLLKMLYRNAGLHEDMPPDMAEDPVLRKKMFDGYREICALINKLKAYDDQIGDGSNRRPVYDTQGIRQSNEKLRGEQDSGGIDSAQEMLNGLNEYLAEYMIGGGTTVLSLAGSVNPTVADHVTGTSIYGKSAGVLGGLTAVLGFIGATLNSIGIASDKVISAADRTGQALGVSSDFIGSSGTTVASVSTLGSSFSFLGETTANSLAVAGGSVVGLAGAIKTGASAVQMGRAFSSRNDLQRSKEALGIATLNRPLHRDEKILKRFLKHENREVTRQEVSAGVGIATGVCLTASGAFLATGLLPLAAAFGLAAIVVDGFGKLGSYIHRGVDQMKAVDDMLQIDEIVQHVLNEHERREELAGMNRSDLKKMVREETLAMMGFSSYKACYRQLCVEFATLLYNKVFVEHDNGMYRDAMKSLGMKMKDPVAQGDEGKPSIAAMVTRLMSG